ncbi:hypothetical protein BAUCODRAFT_64769 [Baudoinia panamericana UAMH 10762]|uniref:VIT domain-containing protein n=1 Tax=Baudoinia panamericana (strain UAMH 10762) TaxID=717646 RepID=M2MPN4_BAUPA|nr:uncharacterized protein BAUCODRAFT_64769 [Baudoinia panamericana UAMH 10762]EMC98716.1 hypothetical protein BAUCODRAFT_64769 [Baudoinia panamericana UAMH 10762]
MRHNNFGGHICGCHYTINISHWKVKRYYLPQVKLESHTTITPVSFTTKLTQTYHNPEDKKLDQVRYTFPLYDGVAVHDYTIRYADKILKGIVKQKDVAKKTYDAAIERGETAGLLESLPAGVFGVTLGNVPTKTDIIVEITYCGELKHDAEIDGLRYTLPTSIAPRYGSYPGEVLNSNTTAKGGISIKVDIDMASSAIRKIQSPSHPIAVSMGATSTTANAEQAPFTPDQASATLTLGSAELAGDFVLQMLVDNISEPKAILEAHPSLPNQRAIMATLVPKFTLKPSHPEIVFIADQSGSMRGSKNTALVNALQIFIKSLPLGVRFNIIAFGNNFTSLWPSSQAYNETSVDKAIAFVNGFTASYGGTEILKPVKAAFEQRLKDLPLEVMLLTDGEVWQENSVFSFINEQVHDKKIDARVFALGIGSHVSHTLVEGVARAGNGFAQFVQQDEETDRKVMRMLKGALYAHTRDYKLEVHYADRGEKEARAKVVDLEADDEDFEIVEKVEDCLKLNDDQPPAYEAEKAKIGQQPTARSFFDQSADLDKSVKDNKPDADRYAHLPPIATPKLLQAPTDIPPLFPFNRTTVYLLLGPDSAHKEVSSITLRATSDDGPLELTVPIKSVDCHSVPTIHQLAARKAMQDLEEGRGWLQTAALADGAALKTKNASRFDEMVEREAVRLGEKFQVVGKWTSFVAVEANSGDVLKRRAEPEWDDDIDTGITPERLSAPMAMMTAAHAPMSRMRMASAAAPAPAPQAPAATSRKFKLVVSKSQPANQPAELEEMVSQEYSANAAAMAAPRSFAPPAGLARPVSTASPMQRLISLQTFAGSWAFTSALLDAIGKPGLLKGSIHGYGESMSDEAKATLLAIAFFESKLPSEKDVWEMVVEKGRRWLMQHGVLVGPELEKMVQEVKKLL